MTTLSEFLLARIAEDEADARDPDGGVHERGCGTYIDPDFARPECSCDFPARVLAECEAKRAVLDALRTEEWFWMVMALPYADHPDYADEWRP